MDEAAIISTRPGPACPAPDNAGMTYLAIKHLHVTCVVLSASLFTLRAWWMLTESPRLQAKWVRVLPHIIDTVLLTSALTLAALSSQWPFQRGWLTAKVLALLAYIVLGSVALKRGKTPATRRWALVGALLCLGYIVGAALTRSATLGLALAGSSQPF